MARDLAHLTVRAHVGAHETNLEHLVEATDSLDSVCRAIVMDEASRILTMLEAPSADAIAALKRLDAEWRREPPPYDLKSLKRSSIDIVVHIDIETVVAATLVALAWVLAKKAARGLSAATDDVVKEAWSTSQRRRSLIDGLRNQAFGGVEHSATRALAGKRAGSLAPAFAEATRPSASNSRELLVEFTVVGRDTETTRARERVEGEFRRLEAE